MILSFCKHYRSYMGNIAVLSIYAGLTFIFMLKHSFSVDESQSWLMARDAANLIELYQNAPWSGRPFLWNFILFPFVRLGFSFHVTAVINWILLIGVVGVFLFRAPFPWFVKYPFVSSFYMLYEYAFGGRDYVITILLLFLIASIYSIRFKRPFLYGMLVFLLFNSLFFAFPLAFSLMVLYFTESILSKEISWNRLWALAVMLLGCGLSFVSGFFLPTELSSAILATREAAAMWHQPLYVLLMAFVPAPITLFSIPPQMLMAFGNIFAITVLCFFIISMIKKIPMFFISLFLVFILWYMMVFRIGFPLATRHGGLMLMMMIFILWIQSFYQEKDFKIKYLSWINNVPLRTMRHFVFILVGFSLLFSASSTICYVKMDLKSSPGAKEMASFIQGILKNKEGAPRAIVAFSSVECMPVFAWLPKQIVWCADTMELGTWYRFTVKSAKELKIFPGEVVVRAGVKFQDLSNVLFLLDLPLPFETAFGYRFVLLKRTKRFFLYKPVFIGNLVKDDFS